MTVAAGGGDVEWGQDYDLVGVSLFLKGVSPGWCGSVDRALACEPKDGQFNTQSEL